MELTVNALQEYVYTGQFWLLLLLGGIVFCYVRSKRYNLPPRPHGWPLVGNMFAINRHQTYKWLKELAKDYGPVLRITLGPDVIVINDMKSAHEALVGRAKDFSGRPSAMLFEEISEHYQSVAFSDADTHMWPQRRKLQVIAIRNFTSGRMYEERLFMTFGILMKVLDEKANAEEAFNPITFCKFFICNLVGGMCFSRTFDIDDPEFLQIIDFFDQFNTLTDDFQISDFLPFAKYLPFDLPDRRRAKKAFKFVLEFWKDEWQKHKNTFTGKESGDVAYYVMKMMAEDQTLAEITDVEQRQLINDLFGGGVDTVQVQLRWIFACLAKYQDMQDKIYEEIMETIGPIDKDDEDFGVSSSDHRAKMPYSEAFLLEVTRYGTVTVMGFPRKTLCDTKIGEYDIPKGTQVFVNQWAINYDPDQYDDPEELRPERFLTVDGLLGPRPNSYISFGLGRRACPGETATRNTLWMVMIMLLRRYQILPAHGQDFQVEFGPSFLIGEPKDFEIQLKYRSSD